MKTLEKITKIMTWLAWLSFVYGLARLETPTGLSCTCLVFSAVWLITSALLKEELAGGESNVHH